MFNNSNKKSQKDAGRDICPIWQINFEDKDEVNLEIFILFFIGIIELKWSENHIFHEDWIKNWLVVKQDCPLCRRDLFNMDYSRSSLNDSSFASK